MKIILHLESCKNHTKSPVNSLRSPLSIFCHFCFLGLVFNKSMLNRNHECLHLPSTHITFPLSVFWCSQNDKSCVGLVLRKVVSSHEAVLGDIFKFEPSIRHSRGDMTKSMQLKWSLRVDKVATDMKNHTHSNWITG